MGELMVVEWVGLLLVCCWLYPLSLVLVGIFLVKAIKKYNRSEKCYLSKYMSASEMKVRERIALERENMFVCACVCCTDFLGG